MLGITILKSGVPAGGKQPVVWDPETFPRPVNAGNLNSTYGLRTLGYLLNLDSEGSYLVVAIAATTVCLLAAAVAIVKSPWGTVASRRVTMVVVLGGPLTWTVLREYHGVDPWVLSGSVIVASMAWGRVGLLVGLVLMLLGNPEQTLAAMLALVLASLAPSIQAWRTRALIGLASSTFVVVVLTLWTESLGDDNRISMLRETVITGGGYFLSWGYLGIYAGLGLAPVFAFALWRNHNSISSALAFGLAFMVPVIATVTTLDQSRVFVGTSTLLVTAITLRVLPSVLSWFHKHELDGQLIVVVAVALLPVVHIEYPSVLRPPLLIVSETLGTFL